MTLRELQYLVALAQYGHFGRAAEACHMPQPALSTQIRKLEDALGAALFERGPRQESLPIKYADRGYHSDAGAVPGLSASPSAGRHCRIARRAAG